MKHLLNYDEVLRNIEMCYSSASPVEIIQGRGWYTVARHQCKLLAQKYHIPLHIVCAVVSAMSPNCAWNANLKDADRLLYCYEEGYSIRMVGATTYPRNIAKAWSIREKLDISPLRGPKVRAFYNCLVNSMSHDVCCDIHIYCISSGQEYTTKTMPHILSLDHKTIVAAFRALAKKHHTMPHRIQATVWVVRRRTLSGSRDQASLPWR